MQTLELADFIPHYPGSQDEGFQRLISEKYEYAELASGPTEKAPSVPGEFYKHQKLTHRYLRNYDRLLLMDEPGTGKTCSVLGFTEYAYDQYLLARERPELSDPNLSRFKRVYVLVSNKATKENFINQLVCRCSRDGRYLTKGVVNAKNINGQKMALAKAIRNWYRVSTYYGIVKEYNKIKKESSIEDAPQRLREHFSDCIFWIDEVHNLTSDTYKTDTDAVTKKWSIKETYDKLAEIIHTAERTKVILSTATPMINETREFIKIINLLLTEKLPADLDVRKVSKTYQEAFFPTLSYPLTQYSREQLINGYRGLMPEDTDIDNLTLEELEVYDRGKIIFTKALDTGINVRYQFNPELDINKDEMVITPNIYISQMSPFQKSAYLRAIEKDGGSFYGPARQASNFVFPDGSYGGGANIDVQMRINKDLEKWVKKNPNVAADEINNQLALLNNKYRDKLLENSGSSKYIYSDNKDNHVITEELRQGWNANGLEYYSTKFHQIVEGIKNSTIGTNFVYSEYVYGSGAIVLGLALEHFAGFRRYRPLNNAVFFASDAAGKVRSYCGTGDQPRQLTSTARANIEQGIKQYALITGDTVASSEYAEIMDIFNSPENWNGQLIKVLIVSRIGRVGININNATRIDLVGPEFNKNNAMQANFRALRATGHVELLKHLPVGSRVDVDVFWRAATDDANLTSSDITMYKIMEEKARKIAKVMRKLKQTSIGCHINRARNIPANLVDYSADCDYDLCNYPCVSGPFESEDELDFLTYDLYYSQEIVQQLVQVLKQQIFPAHNKATLTEILDYLKDDIVKLTPLAKNKKYLILALEQIIVHKQQISNRFGQICYLMEDGDLYYLDHDFPTDIRGLRALSYYTEKLFAKNILPIDDIYRSKEEVQVETILEKLAVTGNLDTLSLEEKEILNRYRKNIYQMMKPIRVLEAASLKLQQSQFMSGNVVGRKRIGGPEQLIAKNIKDNEILDNYDPCTITQPGQYFVYAHNLRSTALTTSKSAVGTNVARGSGIRRLYDRERGSWITLYKFSDATEDENRHFIEERVYDFIIRGLARNRREGLSLVSGIYDIKGDKRIFKIINNVHASGVGDKGSSPGRVCTSVNTNVILLLFYYAGVPLESLNLHEITRVSTSQMISELLSAGSKFTVEEEPPYEQWDSAKLRYYYTLYKAMGIKDLKTTFLKANLCAKLEAEMTARNLIAE